MRKDQNSNSYIIRQAESIIDDYVKNKNKNARHYYKEKYERLKILSIAMGITFSLIILFTVIFK